MDFDKDALVEKLCDVMFAGLGAVWMWKVWPATFSFTAVSRARQLAAYRWSVWMTWTRRRDWPRRQSSWNPYWLYHQLRQRASRALVDQRCLHCVSAVFVLLVPRYCRHHCHYNTVRYKAENYVTKTRFLFFQKLIAVGCSLATVSPVWTWVATSIGPFLYSGFSILCYTVFVLLMNGCCCCVYFGFVSTSQEHLQNTNFVSCFAFRWE